MARRPDPRDDLLRVDGGGALSRPEEVAETTTAVSATRDRSAKYAPTGVPNVVYKGTSIYIRMPVPDGGRVRRVTSCTTVQEAARLLAGIESLVKGGGTPEWWPIQAVLDERMTLERVAHFLDPRTGGLPAMKAELEAGVSRKQKAVEPTKSVAEIIDEWEGLKVHAARDPGARLEPVTVSQYAGHMRTAARAMPTLVEWSTAAVQEHLDSLEVRRWNEAEEDWQMVQVHPQTQRRHLWALRSLGDFLVAKGSLPKNPADAVAPRKLKGTVRKKLVWLTHGEWVRILSHVPGGVVKDALEFMLATAAEPGATCALTADKVRADGSMASITTVRKGGETRQRDVIVDRGFRERLAARVAQAGCGPVFPGVTASRLQDALDPVRSMLAAEGFAKHYLIKPYELRHSWACEALDNGARIHDVSAQLGHARVSTTLDIYGPGKADLDRVSRVRDEVTAEAVRKAAE